MKRRVVLILLLLVAGAIINVAVAWGCALWARIDDFRVQKPTPAHQVLWHRFVNTKNSAAGVTRNEVRGFVYQQISGAIEPNDWEFRFDDVGQSKGIQVTQWPDTPFGRIVLAVQSGWPALSVQGFRSEPRLPTGDRGGGRTVGRLDRGFMVDDSWLERRPSKESAIHTALALTVNRNGKEEQRLLPFGPLWPGFAINTVFYAFILWLLFAAPFALRRRRRIKRGLCPKCAYPVGTNEVCTECGAAIGGAK